MHIANHKSSRVAKLVLAVVVFFTTATASVLPAEPIAVHGETDNQPLGHDVEFAGRVDRAADLIRKQTLKLPKCRAYFERLGVDIEAWLAPNQPPYVIPRRLHVPSGRSIEPVCGGAQGQPPFEFLFVDKRCFRGPDICALASLLLHEMGHLARRDTRDNEPPEFFAACRLSSCVNPARYY